MRKVALEFPEVVLDDVLGDRHGKPELIAAAGRIDAALDQVLAALAA